MITHDGETVPVLPAKDPNETLWYNVIWDDILPAGVAFSTVLGEEPAWVVPTGLTLVSQQDNVAATLEGASYSHVNRALISGGTAGTEYTITNRVHFDDGQIIDRSFTFLAKEK